MAKNPDNARIYGGEDSGVYVAPKGTTGPTGLAAPTGFTELGWLSEDGISFERSEDVTTHRAFQGATIIRRAKTSVEDTFTFQCLEETATVLGLYYAGQEPVVSGTGESAIATITVKEQTKVDERAFVVDLYDGDVHKRYVIPRASIGVGSIAHSNSDITVYEFTCTIQGDYSIITNSPAVAGE
jgi:hypothetical protein